MGAARDRGAGVGLQSAGNRKKLEQHYDIGEFGINSVHLPELAKYGISKEDLLDGCKSAYVAGWRVAKMVRKYGNTWVAYGAYHSENPGPRDLYASRIQRIINFWIAKGIIPVR